jgi:hypothetical protein
MPQWLSSVLPLPGAPYPATVRPCAAARIRKPSRSLLIFSTAGAKPSCPATVCSPAASSAARTSLTRSAGSPAHSCGRA